MKLGSNINSKQKESQLVEGRKLTYEVKDFLNDSINQIRPLKYNIRSYMNPNELIQLFEKDLPLSRYSIGRKSLIDDLVDLSKHFFDQTISKNIHIQLEVIKTNMCRLFHVDNMRQRLLCTYKGPGTEWLDHSNVKREGLGKGCNEKIVKDFSKINRAKTFEVLLLKGKKYGEKEPAMVHRSPQIEEVSKTRVLLKIDECEKGDNDV